MSGRGARPIEDLLRLLLAIADALSREGATIDARGVAYLLGLGPEDATRAIQSVLEAATGADASTGVVVPLEGDPERGISLMEGHRPLPALRMTRAEAQALEETLDVLGIDDEALGGIRPKVAEALFPVDWPPSPVRPRTPSSLAARLVGCLDAIYSRSGLAFAYEGERGVAAERRVEPLSLRHLFGQWVLDALDLTGDPPAGDDDGPEGAGGDLLDRRRFFVVSRIRHLRTAPLASTHPEYRGLPWEEGGSWVRLYFTDRGRFDANPQWTWAREVPRSQLSGAERRRIGRGGCAVDVRYFPGSPYLVRLIVSCAGTCTTDDPVLVGEIRRYLATLP